MVSWYVGMGHDPEVPAGYQDADIEMAEMYEAAAEAEAEAQTFKRGDHVAYKTGDSVVSAWIIDPDVPFIRLIGDDRDFEVDPSQLTPIDRDDFCGGCGQIGCGHG